MADLTGHTLGRYQVVARLGRGGMADVYQGFHPGLDRYVAIKVLHPHLAEQSDFVERFRREARAVASLQHPHIVQVFDFDIQDDAYFMVMEFIEGGQTLKEWLAARPRPPLDEALRLAAQVADGLDYAHARAMIHRDIKPANVLLRGSDAVVSDFGIARLLDSPSLTASGSLIGTPAYMSPEQGRGETLDGRSDLYSLGIVLYELLVGHPPYEADTPYGVILKHIHDPLPSPRQQLSSLPASVERLLLRALAKEPGDRFASAAEMRAALHAARQAAPTALPLALAPTEQIAGPTASAASTPAPARPVRPVRARWWGALALAALLLLLLASALMRRGEGATASSTGPTASPTTPRPADRSQADALALAGLEQFKDNNDFTTAQLAEALRLDPNNATARVGQALLRLEQNDTAGAAPLLAEALARAPDNPLVQYGVGRLRCCYDETLDSEAALAAFERAVQGCAGVALSWLCAESLFERGYQRAWQQGDIQAGLDDLHAAIEQQASSARRAGLYGYKADMLLALGDVPGAIAAYGEGYDQGEAGEFPWLLDSAAKLALRVGEDEQALALYERLVSESPEDPNHLVGLGYARLRGGDAAGAAERAQRALALDPSLLPARYLQGLVALAEGEDNVAAARFGTLAEQADLWDAEWAWRSPFTPEFGHELFYELARAALAQKRPDDAQAALEQSLSRADYWPQPYLLQGDLQREANDLAGAHDSYLRARQIAEELDQSALVEEASARLKALIEE